jgi:uncharacterized membrane protein YgaE (UPF0421/DUF939 family)
VAHRDLPGELRLALKMAGGSALAWWLSTLLGEERPIFAAIVPLVALSGDPFSVVSVSISRVLGVFAGVAIGIGLLQLHLSLFALVVLALVTTTLVGIGLRIGDRPNIEPAFSALFLIAFYSTGAASAGVARLWETAIGAGVAVLFAAFVWPPHPVRELEHRLERLRRELLEDLAAVATDLTGEHGAVEGRIDELRAHSRDAIRDVFELERARRAMRWNPLRHRDAAAFEELARRINLAARLYRHARAIARDVADGHVHSLVLARAVRELIEASDLALRGRDHAEELGRAAERLAADDDAGTLILRAQLRQLLDDLRTLA